MAHAVLCSFAADHTKCEKIYAAPCPANWYAFNGGASCAAPKSYAGACASVDVHVVRSQAGLLILAQLLHGMLDLPISKKSELENKCQFTWPCYGEKFQIPCTSRRRGCSLRGEIYESVLSADLGEFFEWCSRALHPSNNYFMTNREQCAKKCR